MSGVDVAEDVGVVVADEVGVGDDVAVVVGLGLGLPFWPSTLPPHATATGIAMKANAPTI
jgi:hypothetical protein